MRAEAVSAEPRNEGLNASHIIINEGLKAPYIIITEWLYLKTKIL